MSHHVQVIAADGEMRASLALAEASGVIQNSPAAIKLRHLQTLNACGVEKNSTVMFPVPMDLYSMYHNQKTK